MTRYLASRYPHTRVPTGLVWGYLLLNATLSTDAQAQQIDVVGTRFKVTIAGGRVLNQDELLGATLSGADEAGNQLLFRVDAVEPDPKDESGEVVLYTLMVSDSQHGTWRNLCNPDPDGLARGFPIRNLDKEDGSFSLTCTSGAVGKCIRMGYKPCATNDSGNTLRGHHQACVRMLRADYCGNGDSHTRDGTVVNIFDKLGIQKPDPEPAAFEAAWGPDGAVCVNKTRIPDVLTLDELVLMCPEKLQGLTGETCSEAGALHDDRALILNRS